MRGGTRLPQPLRGLAMTNGRMNPGGHPEATGNLHKHAVKIGFEKTSPTSVSVFWIPGLGPG